MASKQTYPCFACRKAGHEIMIFLDGKDKQGRTKYLNEDGTAHQHKTKQQQGQQQQTQLGSTTVITEPTSMKIINAKLDRIISLLETGYQSEDAR